MMTGATARLRKLARALDDLATRSMEHWFEAGLDPLGGAHGFLDRQFRPVVGSESGPFGPSGEVLGDQSLVQQARHLYVHSLYAERRPADRKEADREQADRERGQSRAAAFAHRLYAHLLGAFDEGDVFVNQRARDGRVRSRAVQLYAQGFAIYALATYGRVFAVDRALACAESHFARLDARMHDPEFGGYGQLDDGDWLAFVSAPPAAVKCTNTHIHALEALTALSRALPLAVRVHERTRELAQLVATRLRQPAGNLHPFFDGAWNPVGPPRVSYGHDVETAWLLLDAIDALAGNDAVSMEVATTVQEAAIALVSHALRTGWDPAGGFFDHGVPEGAPEPARVLDRSKIWWAQAEALPGLYGVYRLTKDETLIARLEQTLEFFTEKSWDQQHGGYFWGVDSQGRTLGRGDHKGEIWKTPYHDVRACLLTADWIREDLVRSSAHERPVERG